MLIGIDASRAFVKERTGTENYSYQLIRAIAKIDHKNKYVLYTRSDLDNMPAFVSRSDLGLGSSQPPSDPGSEQLCDPGWPDNFTFKNIPLKRFWTQIGLAKEVLLNPPDVLFVPAHTLPIIHRPGLKTVVTIHDLGYEYLPQYHKFPHKLYLNKSTEFAVWHSTHLIAVSQATKQDLIEKLGCPKEKITVVYEGYDEEKFRPMQVKSPKFLKLLKSLNVTEPYILFVGTLQPRKNIARLIEAFAIVIKNTNKLQIKNRIDPNLIIAGNKGWLYDEILDAPKKFGVSERVKFLGYTKEDDLPALYSGALAFCLPSLFEGFGLPVLEAMACGCPVVVSNTSSLPEVAGKAGIYIDPLSVEDIAKNLQFTIYNLQFRKKMSEKSLEQAKKFSWEKTARETVEILEKTASS